MPGASVSAIQFGAQNSMESAPNEGSDLPQPGSSNNYGSKRFTAWATRRGSAQHPMPGTKSTMGSWMDFSEE